MAIAALAPPVADAQMRLLFGGQLEYQYPIDADVYGGGMRDNTWGRDVRGLTAPTGESRNQYYSFSTHDALFLPGLMQGVRFGEKPRFSFELTESLLWFSYAPSRDLDIVYDRFQIPILATARLRFFPTANWHPTLLAGAGAYYMDTRVSGGDLYNQARNPAATDEPEGEGLPAERNFFRNDIEFRESAWAFGVHAGAGFEVQLLSQLLLVLDVTWSVVPVDTFDVVFVRGDSLDDFHWEKRNVSGDAGGLRGGLGVRYLMIP
ncbi:hypothetical protein K8I61_17805 [bacterium]|nr:hypothetical protein [bacterium]